MSGAGGSFFDQFQRSAWRLETRRFYQPDAEEFHRHAHGQEPTGAQQTQRRHWIDHVQAATGAGRTIGRVLVVTLPLSPYHRWRAETARSHLAAGEDIRIADLAQHPQLAQLQIDFWLLDDERVLVLDYDDHGRFTSAMPTQVDVAVDACRRYRDLALACSTPLQEFLLPA